MTATEPRQFLKTITSRLDAAGIPYMICGSVGSSFHGRPRATNDVDIVISATQQQLDDFLATLGEGFYTDRDAAMQAWRDRDAFNVIQAESGWKADLMLCKDRPFSRQEFARRREVDMMGMRLYIVSAEDGILSKLEWAKKNDSERQFRDAVGIGLAQASALDRDYLATWATELGVQDLLARLLAEVDGLS